MSFTDRLVLWLHVGFAIFTIGPVTVAIMSTPRYIRNRNTPIVRYLARMTVIFTIACLGVLVAGLYLAQLDKDFSHPWLTASATLFIVAIVLLMLIIRDQRKAINAMAGSTADPADGALAAITADVGDQPVTPAPAEPQQAAADQAPGTPAIAAATGTPAAATAQVTAAQVASVERGRIAMMGGVVSVIWLVILVLMVWNA